MHGRRREQDLPGRQGATLFAYLVSNRRRAVTREEMLGAIWADDPPPQPYTALRHSCRNFEVSWVRIS
jgi:DNA-binding SARP family transcriptional activator